MQSRGRVFAAVLLLLLVLGALANAGAKTAPDDAVAQLEEIFARRARWLLSEGTPPPLEQDYLVGSRTAQWALEHEKGKIRYVKQWVKNRGVRLVEARPKISARYLSGSADRARFYVGQSLSVGYLYPGEHTLNRFGVGSRHIVDLRRQDGRWVIALEWYSDPLGEQREVPAGGPAPPNPAPEAWEPDPNPGRAIAVAGSRHKGYDRQGVVEYADTYCGLAAGCGNNNRYNTRFRDYSGEGGNCTNFASQALREGGKLRIPIIIRVDSMVSYLQYTGRASVAYRGTFPALGKRMASDPRGLRPMLQAGDLIAYQVKGKMEHLAIVTGFDSRGYPLVNSHTSDRYHVPFDLGWDRRTIYWLVRMHG